MNMLCYRETTEDLCDFVGLSMLQIAWNDLQ